MFELAIDKDIHVRTLHPDDAEALFRLLERNRARLRPWIGPSLLPETVGATRIYTIECYLGSLDPMVAIETPYIDEVRPYFPPAHPPMEMGIWSGGELAGVINLSVLEDSQSSVEFGYWISQEQEGKGIVTRCVRALMEHARSHLQTERFIIGCAAENQRSRAVPERLGYRLREVLPQGEVAGEYVYDRCVYEFSAADRGE